MGVVLRWHQTTLVLALLELAISLSDQSEINSISPN